jgi:hypothetical protein
MKVDFPDPFGPVRPYRRPFIKVAVTSSKSTFDPYRMDTLWTAIICNLHYPLKMLTGKQILYGIARRKSRDTVGNRGAEAPRYR